MREIYIYRYKIEVDGLYGRDYKDLSKQKF